MSHPGQESPKRPAPTPAADAAPNTEMTLSQEDFDLISVFDFRVMNSLTKPYNSATLLKTDPFNASAKEELEKYSAFLHE